MVKSISRERWSGKYRTVVRIKGKIQSSIPWSPKFQLKQALARFKSTGSLRKGVIRQRLTNVTEQTNYNIIIKNDRIVKLPRISKGNVQYVISGILKDGTVITARSRQVSTKTNKSELREETQESFFELVSQHFNAGYDSDEGRKFIDGIKSTREGLVFYR